MEEVIAILNSIHPGVDFENEQHLIDDGLLSSMEIMMLVARLEKEFDIKVRLPEIRPENFQSAAAVNAMVDRLMDE